MKISPIFYINVKIEAYWSTLKKLHTNYKTYSKTL